MTEREKIKLITILKGKQADMAFAEEIREAFINEYKDDRKIQELLSELGSNTVDKLIYRLNCTEKIQLYRDYRGLREVAEEVIATCYRKVYDEACGEENARVWINNKGKYHELVFESLYKVFRADPRLQDFIEVQ